MKVLQRLRGYKVLRYISLSLPLVVALLAAAIVASLTIDLGPAASSFLGYSYQRIPLLRPSAARITAGQTRFERDGPHRASAVTIFQPEQ